MGSMRSTFYTTEKIGPKQSLTPEGFLLCEGVSIARTGMMIYGPEETPVEAGPEGIVKIFREDAEVFRPETIASAQGKPVTNDHPDDDVVPDTWKELAHGFAMNVRRGEGALDDLLLADFLITTPEGIEAVQSGKREVSMGYEADYEDMGNGTGKQTNLIINHIALVEQGRCGPRCAISDHKPKGNTMAKKSNKILDTLMRAFKAKDADEVEKLAEEVKDEGELVTSSEGGIVKDEDANGDTHIHIHTNGNNEGEGGVITEDDESGEEGRAKFTDDDIQAHMDKNATEHAEMFARIEELEKLLASQAEGATDEANEMTEEAADEVPEELQQEAMKAKDSSYLSDSFRDTVALAEILVPGIRIPTFDRAMAPSKTFKAICSLRKQALDLAYVQPSVRAVLDDLLAGKELSTKTMTCDAARTLFRSSAAMVRAANNGKRGTVDTKVSSGPMTLAELNRKNAARYQYD